MTSNYHLVAYIWSCFQSAYNCTKQSTEVYDALESDHMCVITQLDVTVTPPVSVYRVVCNVRAINQAALETKIFMQNWATSHTPQLVTKINLGQIGQGGPN